MTYLHSSKRNNVLYVLFVGMLLVPLITGTLWLVAMYNGTVNVRADIARAQEEILERETAITDLKDNAFSLVTNEHLEQFAAESGLVEEKHPSYFQIRDQWGTFALR